MLNYKPRVGSEPAQPWSVLGQDSLFLIASVYPAAKNGYLGLKRQCLELVRYMVPLALEYPLGD